MPSSKTPSSRKPMRAQRTEVPVEPTSRPARAHEPAAPARTAKTAKRAAWGVLIYLAARQSG